MNKILLVLFITPIFCKAQKQVPRLENDTLYTTCGYKIYKGSILHLAKGTGANNKFRFLKLYTDEHGALHNSSILVNEMKSFIVSGLGNAYIRVAGIITYNDSSKGKIDLAINFEKAIESFPGLQPELIIPDEYKNNKKSSIANEIAKLNALYKDSIITKEEFEAAKKKLLKN